MAGSLDRQYERLENAIARLQVMGKINEQHKGLRTLASLRAYREAFNQLRCASMMHVAIESLRHNIDLVGVGLPSAGGSRVRVTNDVPETLTLPTIWPLLRFVLKQLLSNAIASARHAGGEVGVSASIEADSEMRKRRCRICVTNQGVLMEGMRTSILQRRPVLKPDGEYGVGLLAAGAVLTVLGGYLCYPEPRHGIIQAIAVLRLDGDRS